MESRFVRNVYPRYGENYSFRDITTRECAVPDYTKNSEGLFEYEMLMHKVIAQNATPSPPPLPDL